MKRRILSVLMALALCLGLLPGTAWAESRTTTYFQIAGRSISGATPDVFNDGTVSVGYEKSGEMDKWTIHLKNAHLTGQIRLYHGLVDLVLEGANTINATNADGIDLGGSLTIKGNGSLTVISSGNAIAVSSIISPAQYDGSVKIESVSDLKLEGGTLAINAVGDVEISESKVTASNNDASNPAIRVGKCLRISNSEVTATNAQSDAISASGDITIENSTVTANAPLGTGLYTFETITIKDNSTVTSTANTLGICGDQGVVVSDSEVEVHSSAGNAIYTQGGLTISTSSVTARTDTGDWPAVYVCGPIQISNGTVEAVSPESAGMFTLSEMTVGGASAVTAKGGTWAGLSPHGGLILNGGEVSAESEDFCGFQSYEVLTINGGKFHAKGKPAVAVMATRAQTEPDPDPVITLAEGLTELNGGEIAISDWITNTDADGYSSYSFFSSFVSPGTEQLEAYAANGMNEVTVCTAGADYSTVNAALAKVPVDLSKYTDETVAVVRSAVAAVERGLGREEQARVDGFAAAIEAAIAGLTEKSSSGGDIPYYPAIPGTPGNSGNPTTPSQPGTTVPTQPVTTETTTQSGTSTTETTAIPTANTQDGTASAAVDASMGDEIVRQAVDNNSETVVIAPQVTGDVAKTEVSIPAATVGQIGSQTSASLTVSTPVAGVTIPNGGLGSLASAGGTVTVAAEKAGNTVELSVTAGGRTVEHVPGGLTLTVPASSTTPGTVAVLLREDGTREVVRKSVADGGSVTVPLDGSARLEIVDNGKQFADVPAGSWAADAAAFVSAHELFSGTAPDRFDPDKPMSRGMLAVVLHNLEGNPFQAVTNEFADVDGGAWYAQGVAWATARSIIGGYGNGRFGPNDNITREQLAVILWRYAGSPAATDQALDFTDADRVSGWALDALRWAVENGVLSGKGGGILDPQGYATRAETAQILKNFMERQ